MILFNVFLFFYYFLLLDFVCLCECGSLSLLAETLFMTSAYKKGKKNKQTLKPALVSDYSRSQFFFPVSDKQMKCVPRSVDD